LTVYRSVTHVGLSTRLLPCPDQLKRAVVLGLYSVKHEILVMLDAHGVPSKTAAMYTANDVQDSRKSHGQWGFQVVL